MNLHQVKTDFAENGYCVLENLLDPSEAERLDEEARPLMDGAGYVKLEGTLNHLPDLAPLCIHSDVLSVVEHALGPDYYLVNNVCTR